MNDRLTRTQMPLRKPRKRRAAGRPRVLRAGQRVNVYLDAATLERARALGGGNLSEGIRAAVRGSVEPLN